MASVVRSGRDRLITLAVVALLFGAWESAVRVGLVSALFFPPPSAIAAAAARKTASGELPAHLAATLRRVFIGFTCGAGAGIALGLAMGWSVRLRAVTDPVVAALHPIPKTALLPLFIVLLGLGDAPRILVVGLAAFFPSVINAMAGVRQLSPIHFEVAHNYGAAWHQTLTHVVLPGSLPLVLAGARVALNSAVVVTIAVELVNTRTGLGHVIWEAGETMRIEDLYAGVVTAALVGIGLNAILRCLTTRLVPWERPREIYPSAAGPARPRTGRALPEAPRPVPPPGRR